jgi:hypothetical protein
MSEEKQNKSNAATNVEEGDFVEQVHDRTKRALFNAKVVSMVLAAIVTGYMWWLSSIIKENLTEENIRLSAVGWLEGKLDNEAPKYIQQAKDLIPKVIQEEVPNYIMSRIPEVRKNFQTQAEDYVVRSLDDVKPKIEKAVDDFLEQYKDDMKQYTETIEAAKNTDADERKRLESLAAIKIRELADAFVDNLLRVAQTRKFGDPQVDRAYKTSLFKLKGFNADLSNLAISHDRDLTQEDQDLRYAIALMLDKLEWSTPTHVRAKPDKVETPVPNKKQ